VIALDSSAIVAVLTLEPGSNQLLRALVKARGRLVSAVTLLETSMVIAGKKPAEPVFEPLDEFLADAGAEVMPFDQEQSMLAREAFLRFGKGRHPAALNFGDCAAYALAKSRNVPLLFKGDDFLKTDIVPAL
jgi:ribonuclease VapC